MRRIHRKALRSLSGNAERPEPHAVLRNHWGNFLLEHCNRRLRNLVECSNRLGISRLGLLRHDQLRKLGSDIHVRFFN